MTMKKFLIGFNLLILLGWAILSVGDALAQSDTPVVYVINASGPVSASMSEYLRRGIQTAEQNGAEALVMRLNTPGGAVDITLEMVQMMRASQVPVIVYVSPEGAIAGSAGTVLTIAGHLSAMAPGTAIGAASPVSGQGEDLPSTIETKAKEALKATVRSLMEDQRSPEAIAMAEDTIETARAVTGQEALRVGMVDYIARDITELMQLVHGDEVLVSGISRTLNTETAIVRDIPPSFIEQLLATLTNPNIVFILLTIGVQAILIELGNPGGWVAGFIGVSAITVAAFGLGILGANWLGLIFMIVAFVLFILEFKTPTFGALTAGGVVSFIVGALVLFNSPGTPQFARVSVPLVIFSGILLGGTFLAIVGFALRSMRKPIQTGMEAVMGHIGHVQVPLTPTGIVHLNGEQWSATLVEGAEAPKGTPVEVVRAQGLHLFVKAKEQ